MLSKNYLSVQDMGQLKKACLSFAKVQDDTRFGALAIEFNFITQSNLDLALEEQTRLKSSGHTSRIGDLLVDAGMLSQRQRKLILQKQKIEAAGRKESDGNNRTDAKKDKQPADAHEQFDPTHMREICEPEVTIYIRNDALKAFFKKTKTFDHSMLLTDLKFLLEKVGIIYGVVDDDELSNFISQAKYQDTVFQVASGLKPIDGTDAQIVYMFEQDYLKAGNLAEDGTIDFKDRGDIPFVAEGDVLAEKILPKPGKDGVNVYGDVIPQIEAVDVSFNLGKGVHLSTDDLQVIASAEGNPKLKQSGEISVNSAYFIEGDVDYTTGHVKFDKNVYITGSIKSGFRVEAIDVVANTIDGGIVKAQGDVFIQNGVTESSIEAKGSIKAGFIHRSNAMCMGNLNIVKEIVDTDIIIEGTLDISKGRVYSSSICAKGGAKVYTIGSEKAKPSAITVGASLYLEKELATIDKAIEKRQNILEKSSLEKDNVEAELTVVNEKLKNFDQSEQRTLSMIAQIKETGNDSKAAVFQKNLDEAQKKIHDLKNRKVLLETRLKMVRQEISNNAEAVKASVKDKFALKRLNQANPPKPILDVSGKAFASTKINGKHSHLILSQDISHARVMEMDGNQDGSFRSNWEMIITNL